MIFINNDQLHKTKPSITWDDFAEVIGAWSDDDNIIEVFKEIDEERHQDLGTEINLSITPLLSGRGIKGKHQKN